MKNKTNTIPIKGTVVETILKDWVKFKQTLEPFEFINTKTGKTEIMQLGIAPTIENFLDWLTIHEEDNEE